MDQILLNAGLQCAGISDVNSLSSRLMAALRPRTQKSSRTAWRNIAW